MKFAKNEVWYWQQWIAKECDTPLVIGGLERNRGTFGEGKVPPRLHIVRHPHQARHPNSNTTATATTHQPTMSRYLGDEIAAEAVGSGLLGSVGGNSDIEVWSVREPDCEQTGFDSESDAEVLQVWDAPTDKDGSSPSAMPTEIALDQGNPPTLSEQMRREQAREIAKWEAMHRRACEERGETMNLPWAERKMPATKSPPSKSSTKDSGSPSSTPVGHIRRDDGGLCPKRAFPEDNESPTPWAAGGRARHITVDPTEEAFAFDNSETTPKKILGRLTSKRARPAHHIVTFKESVHYSDLQENTANNFPFQTHEHGACVWGKPNSLPRPTMMAWITPGGVLRRAVVQKVQKKKREFAAKAKHYMETRWQDYLPRYPIFVEEPVRMELTFYRPLPLRYFVSNDREKGLKPKHREGSVLSDCCVPDVDNLVKFVLDAMNGIAHSDDKQVVTIIAKKRLDMNYPYTGRTFFKFKLEDEGFRETHWAPPPTTNGENMTPKAVLHDPHRGKSIVHD